MSPTLISNLDERPVDRQLRSSLLGYMAGDGFAPDGEISAAELAAVKQ